MVITAGNPSALEGDSTVARAALRAPAVERIVDRVTMPSHASRVAAQPNRLAARRAFVSFRWMVAGIRNLLRALPASLLVALLAFHGWLLYGGIASGRIFDIDVALRWVAGLALSAVFVGFWRVGVPLLRGRRAVVLWALVVILHAHAMASRPVALDADAPAAQTLISLAVQLGGPLAAAFGLILLAIGLRTSVTAFLRRLLALLPSDPLAHVRTGGLSLAAPRPPPVIA